MKPLNYGIISTASINDNGFINHIKYIKDAHLLAVASRNQKQAKEYAAKRGIPKHYGNYEELLRDSDIDCVYISLPVSLHKKWSIRALKAGKNVLCEKPVASSAEEAEEIAKAVKESGLIFAEAFHYRYHPLSAIIEDIVRSGEIGGIHSVYSQFGVPLTDKKKVQFRADCAGGALLDIGCYPVSFSRWIADCNEAEALRATADSDSSGVDRSASAVMKFRNGVVAEFSCSLAQFLPPYALIKGEKGSVFVFMPFCPSVRVGPAIIETYLLLSRSSGKIRSFRTKKTTTYQSQIEAFSKAVRTGTQPSTDIREGIANMRLIDAIYKKAGVDRSACLCDSAV
jgi:predicted dehydrogenase